MANETKNVASKDLKQRISDILEKDDYRTSGELFYGALTAEMESDNEPWDKKGVSLLRAIANDDIESVFLSLCGWSVPTLLSMAGLNGERDRDNGK